ncbi:hypothetical protein ABIA32_002568 [Streptacidiphilus sp. MAP12-20]
MIGIAAVPVAGDTLVAATGGFRLPGRGVQFPLGVRCANAHALARLARRAARWGHTEVVELSALPRRLDPRQPVIRENPRTTPADTLIFPGARSPSPPSPEA